MKNVTRSLIAAGILTASMIAAVPADARPPFPPLPPLPPLPHVEVRVEPPRAYGHERYDRDDRYDRHDRYDRYDRYRDRDRARFDRDRGRVPVRFWVRGHYDHHGYWVPGHWEVRWEFGYRGR